MANPAASNIAGPCLSDEEIAAFVDGVLHGDERERLIDHLASCKACYDVFAGVMSFEQEVAGAGNGGRIVPFPVAKREEKEREEGRRRGRWPIPKWAAAAAAVLVVGIAYEGYRTLFALRPMTVAGLTEPVQSSPEAARNLYQVVGLRGDQDDSLPEDEIAVDRPSFRVGVLLVDLRLAPQGKDPQTTVGSLLKHIGTEIEEAGSRKDLAASYQQDAQKAKASAEFVGQIAADVPRREAELDSALDHPDAFAFGKWAEACRLAAVTRTPDLFTDRNNRRFLSHVLAQKEKELAKRTLAQAEGEVDPRTEWQAAVLKILKRIAVAWEPSDLPNRYHDLEQGFDELIGQYDR